MSDDILRFPRMPGGVPEQVVHGLEALLFAAGEPIRTNDLADALGVDRRLGAAARGRRRGDAFVKLPIHHVHRPCADRLARGELDTRHVVATPARACTNSAGAWEGCSLLRFCALGHGDVDRRLGLAEAQRQPLAGDGVQVAGGVADQHGDAAGL